MTGQIINGTEISKSIRKELQREIEMLKTKNLQPGLAVVLVGENPASRVYVNKKAKTCEELGVYSEVHRLPENTVEEELLQLIQKLNADSKIHGILVQMPLPQHISEKAVIDSISVHKDVDGFHPMSAGNLMIGDDCLIACTPAGIIELIKQTGVSISGKHAVVIGRSNIVGKPVSMLLLRENATVTVCHSKTENMTEITRQADILVVAAGRPLMVTSEFVKPGAIVIDVGINRLDNGSLAGDVDFEDVKKIAGFITPVPGGVGPMTITMLMRNTIKAAKRSLL